MVVNRNAAFAEESAEVELLRASLDKLTVLTKKIKGSVDRLDTSGQIVRDAIGPIYSNTQQLQITSRNIERINEQIEKLRQPLDTRGREEEIIRAGPQKSGLQAYLAALKRIDRALTDLNSSNLRSNQQASSEFHNLLLTGVTQIQDQFRAGLEEDASPIEPLHFITKQLAFPIISQETISRIAPLAGAIHSASAHSARFGQPHDDVAARIYAEVRGPYVDNSLRNLATASQTTAKRKTADANIYRRGTNGISTYANGLEGMIMAEWENIARIFPRDVATQVLLSTTGNAMNTFQRCLKELNGMIKSRIMYEFPLAYEIIDIITPLSYRFEARTGSLRPQISDALPPIRETSRSSLTEILTSTQQAASSVSALPPDGSSIPLVSETASRLHALATNERPVASLLSSLGDGNWRRSGAGALPNPSSSTLNLELTPSSENPTLLSHYLLDLVDSLLQPLDTRSKSLHRTKPLQGIFLLNAHAILHRTIASTPDLSRYLLITPHSVKLDAYRKTATSVYMSSWREPAAHLLDTIVATSATGKHTSNPAPSKDSSSTARPISGSTSAIDSSTLIKSLSSKDKDKIKEKFRMFNASFDETVARHKSLAMEKEVRKALGDEVRALIEPLYVRFFDRYHEIDKGKGKVVKYDRQAMTTVLAGL